MGDLGRTKVSKANLLFQKAYFAHQAGKLEEAEASYRKALSKAPSDMETLYLLGTVCSQQGKYDEATKYLRKALDIDPNHHEAWNNLGLTLKGQNKSNEALTCYKRALALKPDYADAHNNMGNVLELLGRLDEAEGHLIQAMRLKPDFANAYYNLGLVFKRKDRFEDSVQCFSHGLELHPDFAAGYDELGSIYKIWGRLDQALACFERALSLDANSFSAHNNRGTVFEEMGRLDEALVEYETAAALNPRDTTAKWNTAFLYLRQGVLDRGWEAHELRLGGTVFDRFPYPVWDGSSLEGKTILIYAEQGLGDEILYASCIPDMIERARHCVIECDVRLAPLFSRSFPAATVHGAARHDTAWLAAAPDIDVKIPIGSLPRFVRPTLEDFPVKPAYLVPHPQRVDYWRSRLGELGGELKVGICWRSGLVQGERRKQYSQLSQWERIFSVPRVRFINLQYDECADELCEVESKFGVTITSFSDIDLRNEIDESAALMKALDLVISAGTAVGEIAGSVGVEVYRLDVCGKAMDALGTGRLPWHPLTTLFGQLSVGDWDTTLALVGEALREKIQGGASETEYVSCSDGTEIAVTGSLNDLATYVLKEQRGWFDPEYAFMIDLPRLGAQIVDVGAGVGAYAVPQARRIGKGKLWAITRSAAETRLLQQSRLRNQLEDVVGISIADDDFSLDIEMDKRGLQRIDFVRIARDMCIPDVLGSGMQFFARNSPLVMFGTQPGESVDSAAANWFVGHGYDLYRLIPGLGLLVPVVSASELDSYALNLFACKPDRAESLEQQGTLIRRYHELNSFPGIDITYWQDYLKTLPFTEDLMSGWMDVQQRQQGWEVYWMALNLFAMAKSENRVAAERYACLQAAAGIMNALIQERATLPRLLSLSRILVELGSREAAVSLLNQICALLHSGMPRMLDEPSLALADSFSRVVPGSRMTDWIVAMVLEQRERLRAFSSFFTGQEALPVLGEIRDLGFADEETERRITLIEKRFVNA